MARLDKSKTGNSEGSKMSRFAEILEAAQPTAQEPELLDVNKAEQPTSQTSKKLGTQKSEKVAKRDDPSFTQTTFRIPRKLSRDLDRIILDLEDEGVKLDRSDLLIEMASALLRVAEKEGAISAIEVLRNLGTQQYE